MQVLTRLRSDRVRRRAAPPRDLSFIGRFISADPIVDHTDPQQLQGYAYAENSPISHSDPTGLRTDEQYYGKSGAATMNKEVMDPAEMAIAWGLID